MMNCQISLLSMLPRCDVDRNFSAHKAMLYHQDLEQSPQLRIQSQQQSEHEKKKQRQQPRKSKKRTNDERNRKPRKPNFGRRNALPRWQRSTSYVQTRRFQRQK